MKNANAAELALSKVKIRLMMDKASIFYATILFSLKSIFQDTLSTAATDGTCLYINPTWFLSLTVKQQLGLIVHEVLHVALNHMTRKGTRNHESFNIAGDHVINLALLKAGYELPPDGQYDPKYQDMNTEQVYAAIHKEPIPSNFQGDIIYASNAQAPDVTSQVTNIIMRATAAAKQAGGIGDIPAEIGIILEKNINPKLPWNVILANYLSEFNADDYTMRRLNKKYFPEFYMPTLYNEAICNLAIAVDTSGSVSDKEFSYFIHEIDLIRKVMNPKKMSIIDFDAKIKKIHDVDDTMNILTDIKFGGRGGTDIQPIMDWATKNKPEILLIFSDGEFDLPDPYPQVSLIWLIHGKYPFKPKFGQVIRYEIEN